MSDLYPSRRHNPTPEKYLSAVLFRMVLDQSADRLTLAPALQTARLS
jgi:hypothetical protein